MSTLVFAGPDNKAYFFIFEKMAKRYHNREIPRFTREETEEFVQKYADFNIRPGITIADFWKRLDNYSFVCSEEGVHKLWSLGRIACVGDAVHKMTPNLGAGGNCGIESAAAFANAVVWVKENSHGQRPSMALVEQALQGYQKEREVRAEMMVKSAGLFTRLQAGESFYHRFAAWVLRLYPSDFIADYNSDYFCGAAMLVSLAMITSRDGTNITSLVISSTAKDIPEGPPSLQSNARMGQKRKQKQASSPRPPIPLNLPPSPQNHGRHNRNPNVIPHDRKQHSLLEHRLSTPPPNLLQHQIHRQYVRISPPSILHPTNKSI